MRAVVCHGPGDYRLEIISDPSAKADSAVLQVEAVGICASDVKCFQGAPMFWGDQTRPPYCEAPVVPGHEFVGRIAEIGDVARLRWGVALEDRVVVEQIVPCGQCQYCANGSYWLCRRNDIFGFHQIAQGAMAEYVLLPANTRVYPISEAVYAPHAAFDEPLSCALHAVERADIRFDDVVVIAGAGPIGLGMVAGCRLRGARLIVSVDRYPARLDVAIACGADLAINFTSNDPINDVLDLTHGYGCDVYFEATGQITGIQQGLQMLRKGGRFIEYSVMGEAATTDWTIIGDSKELDVRGAHLGPHCWPKAVQMIEASVLPLDRIASHTLSIEEFQHGFDLVARGNTSIKVSLMPRPMGGGK